MGGGNSTKNVVNSLTESYTSAISNTMQSSNTSASSTQQLKVCCQQSDECTSVSNQIKQFRNLQEIQQKALDSCRENIGIPLSAACSSQSCIDAVRSICDEIKVTQCGAENIDMNNNVSVNLTSEQIADLHSKFSGKIKDSINSSIEQNIKGAFNFDNSEKSKVDNYVSQLVESSLEIMQKVNSKVSSTQTILQAGGTVNTLSMNQSNDFISKQIQNNSIVSSTISNIADMIDQKTKQISDSSPFGSLIKILKYVAVSMALGLLLYILVVVGLKLFKKEDAAAAIEAA